MQKAIYKKIYLKLLAIFFTIINTNNIHIFDNINLIPNLDIMLIFFFTICRIGMLPIWFVFLLGIWSDAINGFNIGISSLLYIILIKLFLFFNYPPNNINDFKKNMVLFFLFLAIFYILKIGFLSIYNAQLYNLYNVIIEFFISVGIYSIFSSILFKYSKED
jgi:cell shape-determining protein MreD